MKPCKLCDTPTGATAHTLQNTEIPLCPTCMTAIETGELPKPKAKEEPHQWPSTSKKP